MSLSKGTPCSSQLVWCEGRIAELEAENNLRKTEQLTLSERLAAVTAERDKLKQRLFKAETERGVMIEEYDKLKEEREQREKQEPVARFQKVGDEYQQVTDDEEYIKALNIDMSGTFYLYAHPLVPDGKVFNVFHEEEYVGSFLQGSFSTREKAQEWIGAQTGNGKFDGELSISEYELDSMLKAAQGEKK